MKRSLSLFLVLCMLLAAVPALVLPVLAEDSDVTVLEEHKFITEFPTELTYTISENKKNEPIGRDAFADDDSYQEWLLSDGVFAIDQGNSNWKLGEFDTATGGLELFARVAFFASDMAASHDVNWAVTESAYQKLTQEYIKNGSQASIWGGCALWHAFMGTVWRQENGLATSTNTIQYGRVTNSGSGHVTAIQYTVPEDGAWGMQIGAVSESSGNGHAIAIFVNDKLVWPTTGTAGAVNTWYAFTKTTTTEMLNTILRPLAMNLKAGDKVSFVTGKTGDAMYWEPIMQKLEGVPLYLTLSDPYGSNTQNIKVTSGQTVTLPTYEGDLIFFGWDADGDGTADYADGATITIGETAPTLTAVILKPSKFYEQLPTWDANNEVVLIPGDWAFGAYEKATGNYLPGQYCVAPFVATTSGGPWGTGAPALYDSARTGIVVANNTLTYGSGHTFDKEEGSYIASLQYTAAYNGSLALDFDALTIKRELNENETPDAAPIVGGIAIYMDGEKVWPTEGEYYWFDSSVVLANEENKGIFSGRSDVCDFYALMKADGTWPFPLNIDGVEMGDVLDIRVVRGTPYNWYFDIRPTVMYTKLNETPMVSATSVDLAENFDLNIYANILFKNDDSTVKMEYWLTKPSETALANGGKALELVGEENGLYKFTYKGLTAKQMTDVIYVRPYTENANGGAYGAVAAVSIRDYALSAMGRDDKLDDLLVAMLNYGSDAQNLFGYADDDLANASLTESQKGMTCDQDKINSVYARGEGDTPIRSASLILGNSIGMKYTVDLVEGATTYELEVSKNADFSDSTKLTMIATAEGKEMKAIYNVKLGDMKDTFYVRAVVDGTAGATLTYSVDSYIIRINEASSDDATWHMTMTLACLQQKLAAYQA